MVLTLTFEISALKLDQNLDFISDFKKLASDRRSELINVLNRVYIWLHRWKYYLNRCFLAIFSSTAWFLLALNYNLSSCIFIALIFKGACALDTANYLPVKTVYTLAANWIVNLQAYKDLFTNKVEVFNETGLDFAVGCVAKFEHLSWAE